MKIKFWKLTVFVQEINAAIDTGKYQNITPEEVEQHIEAKDLFTFLKKRLGEDFKNVSVYDSQDVQEITALLYNMWSTYSGKEYRKWGVEKSGLCLLIAWVTEAMKYDDVVDYKKD